MRLTAQLTLFGIRLAPILLIAYWALIFTGTHLPSVPMPEVPYIDKVQHFVAFLGLAFLLAWAIPTSGRNPRTKMALAFLVAVCYGVVDEWTQQWVGRTSDLKDLAADSAGAFTGVIVYYIAWRLLFPPPRRAAAPASGRDADADVPADKRPRRADQRVA